jgi:HK97 family phage major capsid protein
MTITIPETPDQLRELFDDKSKIAEVFKDKTTATEFIDAYTVKVNKKDPGIAAQIREGFQLGYAEFLKANDATAGRDAPVNLAHKPTSGAVAYLPRSSAWAAAQPNPDALGAKANGIFANRREFMQAASPHIGGIAGRSELNTKMAKLVEIQNSYGTEVPGDGGFLVPEEFRSELMQVAIEDSVTRSRATVIPMSSQRLSIPTIDDQSHVSSIYGGVVSYWTEEQAALVESQASFAKTTLDAKKLTTYALVPNELLADAPAFSGFFDAAFPTSMSWFEDLSFIASTGVGEPRGWLNADCTVKVNFEAGQGGTKTLLWENLLEMYARLLPSSLKNAAWVANKDTFRQLMTMGLSIGTGGSAVLIGGLQQSGSSAPPMSILGLPLILTEKVPSLGTTGDIALVDLSYYLIGDRQQIQTASSPHYKFANDQTAFRIISRVDGRPWLNASIAPHSGSGLNLSPFIQLQDAH